jgi:ribonuclease HI
LTLGKKSSIQHYSLTVLLTRRSKTTLSLHGSRLGDNLLAIYSDVSTLKNETGIGAGLVAYDYTQEAKEVFTQILNISKNQIVYNRELKGLALAFEYAAKVATPLQDIRVHADNQAVISKGVTISIFWLPGHEDVTGNERADALAKQAAMLDFLL